MKRFTHVILSGKVTLLCREKVMRIENGRISPVRGQKAAKQIYYLCHKTMIPKINWCTKWALKVARQARAAELTAKMGTTRALCRYLYIPQKRSLKIHEMPMTGWDESFRSQNNWETDFTNYCLAMIVSCMWLKFWTYHFRSGPAQVLQSEN